MTGSRKVMDRKRMCCEYAVERIVCLDIKRNQVARDLTTQMGGVDGIQMPLALIGVCRVWSLECRFVVPR